MNPEQAKELNHLLLRIGAHLDQSVAFVKDCDSDENFLRYREVVGELMGNLFCDALQPLWQRFPELLPDYLDGPYKVPASAYQPTFHPPAPESPAD